MKNLKCPHCGSKNIYIKQDAIIYYSITKNNKHKKLSVNELDNTWLECDDCEASTDSDFNYSEELNKILKKILK